MPWFEYTGSDRQGQLQQGRLEAPDRASAGRQLAARGLFVLALVEPRTLPDIPTAPSVEESAAEPSPSPARDSEATVSVGGHRPKAWRRQPWSSWQRALYLRQMQVMLEAGIPLYRSARVLGSPESRGPSAVPTALTEVPRDLERGRPLSKALQRTGYFTPWMVASLRLAESSGQLDTILAALADTEERHLELRRAVLGRLAYPVLVLLLMSAGLVGLGHLMSRLSASLPASATSPWLAGLQSLTQSPAVVPVTLLLGIVLGRSLQRLWRRHRSRLVLERAIFALPELGTLWHRWEAHLLTSHLRLLLKSGLPLDRGLGLVAEVQSSLTYRRALLETQRDLREGDELTRSWQRQRLLPRDVLALLSAGEASGKLEESLATASRYCSEQAERTLEQALSLLEPLMIAALGLVLGTVLLLTFGPLLAQLPTG